MCLTAVLRPLKGKKGSAEILLAPSPFHGHVRFRRSQDTQPKHVKVDILCDFITVFSLSHNQRIICCFICSCWRASGQGSGQSGPAREVRGLVPAHRAQTPAGPGGDGGPRSTGRDGAGLGWTRALSGRRTSRQCPVAPPKGQCLMCVCRRGMWELNVCFPGFRNSCAFEQGSPCESKNKCILQDVP